jgi:hypothetical protein
VSPSCSAHGTVSAVARGESGIFVSRRVTSPAIPCKSRPFVMRAFLLFEESSETLISRNNLSLD